jgi:hypothetical protein
MTTAQKHRWSFSLRTLFAMVTVIGIALGWLGWDLHQVRERTRVLKKVGRIGVVIPRQMIHTHDEKPLPFTWKLLGAEPMNWVLFDSEGLSDRECHNIARLFPEAIVEWGPKMDDKLKAFAETRGELARAEPEIPGSKGTALP